MKKHYTIPFFIPHKGCPHKCIFCNQNKITEQDDVVTPSGISQKIDQYLSKMDSSDIEVGFFGGTFTALPLEIQESFLKPVQPYIKKKLIKGIRLSTRPDFIDNKKLMFLKKNNVKCVELGVQSMSGEVLSRIKRGYTSDCVKKACKLIVENDFLLGYQMMIGLPSSTKEDEYLTAKYAKELNASQVRIYPTIVMKDTVLADDWKEGRYVPLPESEAINICRNIIVHLESNGIKVIRCGLHPSEGLLNGENYLAGPFHPAFKLKVESRIFACMLEYILSDVNRKPRQIFFNPKDESAVFGFLRENYDKIKMLSGGNSDFLNSDVDVKRGTLKIFAEGESFLVDRKLIASQILPEELL
ncbi:MAG: radical SAM protein [Candidatus Omnitrophota bacterium]|nr:radical SAM protein [Candidatus Omnitrophota bacterium]